MSSIDPALRARAEAVGVELGYRDVHQRWHDADPAAVAQVVELLEADQREEIITPVAVIPVDNITTTGAIRDVELQLADGSLAEIGLTDTAAVGDPRDDVWITPDRRGLILRAPLPFGCHTLRVVTERGDGVCTVVVAPETMGCDPSLERSAGLFVPAYSLWDEDRPLASFGLLARLARHLHATGIQLLTTLPLYAAFLDEPFDPSPYAPASRLHWNELYLDDDLLPTAPLPELGRYLDWAALAQRRRGQLVTAVKQLDAGTTAAIEAFVADRPDVAAFARFMAYHVARIPNAERETVVRSHELAQFLGDRALGALAADESAAGLSIDLPIGAHRDGYERWAHPDLFVPDETVIGAPPDRFFAEGQNWGLPAQLPGASRRSGHQLWRDLVARAGEHAALVRIDHVMAVHRLWWIPDGFDATEGVYVRSPRDEIMATIAATAAACGTTVVGENLGTVPGEIGELLDRWGMLGMYEEQFHTASASRGDAGSGSSSSTGADGLGAIPARSVSGIRTHDMVPFAAFVADQSAALDGYRQRLSDALGRPVGADYGEILDAVLERLARSAAAIVTADLDDLLGEHEPQNVPGRVLDTNWRRRLDRPLAEIIQDPDLNRRLRSLADRSSGPRRH